MNNYIGSEVHLNNILNAAIKGRALTKQNKQKRIDTYKLNPNTCIYCYSVLMYEKRNNKFCCQSCAAIHNNIIRGSRNEKTKLKISSSLKGRTATEKTLTNHKLRGQKQSIEYRKLYELNPKKCSQCNNIIEYIHRHRKTCSRLCNIKAITNRKFQNGKRKTLYYNGIVLESSWELYIAKFLDSFRIKWLRPKPLIWVDSKNKNRLYFPDFYIPDYNLYLDPKNPYCMKLDEFKMTYFKSRIKIIFGSLDNVFSRLLLHINFYNHFKIET